VAANDVNFILWPIFQTNSRGPGVAFNTGIRDAPILFSAKRVGSQVRVDFSQTLRGGYAPTTIAANYTFIGPSAITTSSVSFTPTNSFLLLNLSGAAFATGTYTLTIVANTVKGANFDTVNSFGTTAFDVITRPKSSLLNVGFN
jgi:hypothetical protein